MPTWGVRGNSKGKALRQNHAEHGRSSRKLMSGMEWDRGEQGMRADRCEVVGKAGRKSSWLCEDVGISSEHVRRLWELLTPRGTCSHLHFSRNM